MTDFEHHDGDLLVKGFPRYLVLTDQTVLECQLRQVWARVLPEREAEFLDAECVIVTSDAFYEHWAPF